MCGILGALHLGRDLDVELIERGRDTLRHRGPDGSGLWRAEIDDSVGEVILAHRRLSILDLTERADQPLLLDKNGAARAANPREVGGAELALLFNGEIYNYVELRSELSALGHGFRSSGDTEVLLRAYAEWGSSCVDRFNGMFAFAIWDRARRTLFCARDRFGEKPFYYVIDGASRTFAFASEAKGLIASGFETADLDPRAVYRYFRFGDQAGSEQTIWRGIRRLPPGHALSVVVKRDTFDVHMRRYWDIDIADQLDPSENAATEEFAQLFADSVRLRLRSDVPIGTSLSGGLDSSSVICEVKRLGAAAGQRAFTARMDDPRLDEGKYVQLLLDATGIPGVDVRPTARRLLDEFDRLYFHQEEPFPSTSLFASYLVHEAARANGVIVLLDGQGADEYLAGYAHYPAVVLADLARRGAWRSWWRERNALRERTGADPVPPRAFLHHLLRRGASGDTALAVDYDLEAGFLRADVLDRFREERPRTIARGPDALKSRLYADLMMGHLQELLRYTDRNAMAVSVEVRLPFLDHRLVEFCMRLPTSHLFRDGTSKRILRRATRGLVPDVILDRTDKVGFATPWTTWWEGSLQTELASRLRDAEEVLSDFVRPNMVAPGSGAALGLMSVAASYTQLRALQTARAAAA
jgi:asparagine synthase (glutamine-hydrolysing)